jgi:hypothetical protein
MAGENTNSTIALTKKVYGDALEKLEFDHGHMGEYAPFKKKTGDTFKWPAQIAQEHGFKYNGTAGSAATLATSVAQVIKQAEATPYEFIGRARIAYRIMEDAAAGGEQAFEAATQQVLNGLMESAEFRREHTHLYGQMGLGVVSVDGGATFTISDATWSAATWESLEGAVLEAFDTTDATANQLEGDLTVSAVDLDAKTVTVTGTSTNVTVGSVLSFKGAKTTTSYNEGIGIKKILSETSGEMFGIDCGDYSRWRANLKASMGTPNILKYLQGLSKLTGRRLKRQTTVLMVPVAAYDILNSDLMSARRFDGSYSKKAKTGFEYIEFAGATGVTEIVPHPMVRDGDSFAFTLNNAFRVGSTDLKFKSVGGDAADMWFPVDDVGANEARVHSIQQIAFLRPAHAVYYSGITY